MFDNTFNLPFNGGSIPMVRVNQDKFASLYRYRDSGKIVDMTIRHTNRQDKLTGISTDRHNVELVYNFLSESNGVTKKRTIKVYFVVEGPDTTTAGDYVAIVASLKDGLMGTDAVTKLSNWES